MTESPLTLIERLEELEKKATAGNWYPIELGSRTDDCSCSIQNDNFGGLVAQIVDSCTDSDLICELRNNAPLLLSLARFALTAKKALEKIEMDFTEDSEGKPQPSPSAIMAHEALSRISPITHAR